MKRLLLIMLVISVIVLLAAIFLPIHGEAEIYDKVVRLHVLANSDSEEDQKLKLLVRDSILELTCSTVENCNSRDEAIECLNEILPEIQSVAEQTVTDNGYGYSVSVELGIEEYPEKTYDNCCLPSGEYVSLRVMIGDAEGHNWWCVLFPPMCMSAAKATEKKQSAADTQDMFVQAGVTKEQYKLITENKTDTKYKVRFRILELIEGIFD